MAPPHPSFVSAQPITAIQSNAHTPVGSCQFTKRIGILGSGRRARSQLVACTSSPAALSMDEVQKGLDEDIATAKEAIAAAESVPEVEKTRVQYLGKKGTITSVARMIGRLRAEDRPLLGASLNKVKDELLALIEQRKEEIVEEERRQQEESEWIDVTMPGLRSRRMVGRIHPLNSTIDIATDIFLDLGYDIIDEPEYNREIETDYYCFEALNCPPDHPARQMQDTFYLDADKKNLLRTQTSSVQIRYMEKNKPPFKIVAPGRVYRRDTVDATHSATFHQIEILAVDKFGVLNLGKLRATMIHFLKEMLGEDIETRFRGSYFPFTEPSMEVDVLFKGKWMEMLGCGMVDPAVLENVGLDPNEWSGFAAGFGVERFAMAMHGVTDIREFYKNDLRFLEQFMIDINR